MIREYKAKNGLAEKAIDMVNDWSFTVVVYVREHSSCCSMVWVLGVLEVYKGGVPPRVQGWLEKLKQDLSPGAVWNLKNAGRSLGQMILNAVLPWTNDSKSGPTRCTGCLPASTSKCRGLYNNGTTRRCMPFQDDTGRNASNLTLTFQSQCTTTAEI